MKTVFQVDSDWNTVFLHPNAKEIRSNTLFPSQGQAGL